MLNQFNLGKRSVQWVSFIVTVFIFLMALFPSGTVWAKPGPHAGPGFGREVRVLPPGHRKVVVNRSHYRYHEGVFYKSRGPRWVIVRPPVGAVVAGLTAAAELVSVARNRYYLCEGTYYKKIPGGYRVVDVMVPETFEVNVGGRVRVTAARLNLRYGPGINHRVVRQISRGTILKIKGTSPGWYYVGLGDGTTGWVMTDYTVQVMPGAKG